MANIEIKIQTQDGADGKIYSVSSSANTNNVSQLVGTKTNKNDGQNMKSWAKGFLSLKDGYVGGSDSTLGKQNGYSGYVFGATDDNGVYELSLTLVGENIDRVVIWGDKNANQFPIRAYLDGDSSNYIFSNDVEWAIDFPTKANSHTITFDLWQRPNYNACITYIAIMLNELTFNNSWIKNVESTSQTTSYPNELFYGVIPNSGSIELLDRNGEISDYVDDGILPNSNVPVQIYANGKKVQDHIINDSSYDINSRVLSTEMTNKLSAWDNIQYVGFSYPNEPKNAFEMLYHCLTSVGYSEDEINEMLSEEIVYGTLNIKATVKAYLENIIIPYPFLEADTLRNTIEKFCRLAQLQVYVNSQDKIKFVSARPIEPMDKMNDALVIKSKNQTAQFNETKILKNQYSAVELSEKKAKDEIDYLTLVNTYKQNIYFDESLTSLIESVYKKQAGASGDFPYAFAWIRAFYMDFDVKIPIHDNNNLREIRKIYEGEDENGQPHIKFEVTYTIKSGTAKTTSFANDLTIEDIVREYVEESDVKTDAIPNEFKYTPEHGGVTVVVAFVDKSNNESKNIIEKDDVYYTAKLRLLVGMEEFAVSRSVYDDGWNITVVNHMGKAYYYTPKDISISFYGDKRIISFEDISASDPNITTAEYVARIDGSELLQENTVLKEISEENGEYIESQTKMSDIIKNNIKVDYSNGISDGVVSAICSDYTTIGGQKEKDWSQGDLIEPLNCIRVDRDNLGTSASKYKDGSPRFWKVVGNRFQKGGVPLQELNVQETKFVETFKLPSYRVEFPAFLDVYVNDGRINSGDNIEMGQNVVIKSINFEYFSLYDGVNFNFIDVNGEKIYINKPLELFPSTTIKITKNTIVGVNYTGIKKTDTVAYINTEKGEPSGSIYYTVNKDKLYNNSIRLYTKYIELGVYEVSDSPYTVYVDDGSAWFDLYVTDTFVNISKNVSSPDFIVSITIEAFCAVPAKTVYIDADV